MAIYGWNINDYNDLLYRYLPRDPVKAAAERITNNLNNLEIKIKTEKRIIFPEPKKIIRNNRTTIVLWEDGTKTIVRCEPHKRYDAYEAFTAALAKKIYGNNTRLKKMILEKYTSQT